MSLREALNVVLTRPKKCKLGKILDELDEDDRLALNQAIDMIQKGWANGAPHNVGPSWIVSALRDCGIDVNRTTVSSHVNAKCICNENLRAIRA